MPHLTITRTAHRPPLGAAAMSRARGVSAAGHAPTRRACEAAAALGVTLDAAGFVPRSTSSARRGRVADADAEGGENDRAATLELPLTPGGITLVLGPSGSGKSTLLRDIADAARARGMRTAADPALDGRTAVSAEDRADRFARRCEAARGDRCVDVHAEIGGAGVVRDRPAVDLLGDTTLDAMNRLAAVGLAELRTFVNRPRQLSTGERVRLGLALVLNELERCAADASASPASHGEGAARPKDVRTVLLLDEFAATLDRHTAISVATALRKRIAALDERTPGVAAVVVTPREELARVLRPLAIVRLSHAGVAWVGCCDALPLERTLDATRTDTRARAPIDCTVCRSAQSPVAVDATRDAPTEHDFEITVESDNAAYHALAPLHYRPGTPATIVRVLAARVSRNDSCAAHQAPRRGELAGVLVVSMPTLNAGWRRFAWGDRFAKTNTAAGARRVNEELRCISRVIVDPRFRSRGVARALVRAYLDDPLTACTEALAAMGVACPFFERAGMTPYRVPPTGRDARLLDLFEQLGVERWRLATPRLAWVRLVDAAERHFGAAAGGQTLARELTRWARASRGTARFGDRPAAELFEIAAPAVIATPVAYAHRTGRR